MSHRVPEYREAGPSRQRDERCEAGQQVRSPFLVLSGSRTMDIRKGQHLCAPGIMGNGVHVHFRDVKETENPVTGNLQVTIVEISVPTQQWRTIMNGKDRVNAAIASLRRNPNTNVPEVIYIETLAVLRSFVVKKVQGVILIHIRDQYDGGWRGLRFATKGIALTVGQWEQLVAFEDEIDNRMAELQRSF